MKKILSALLLSLMALPSFASANIQQLNGSAVPNQTFVNDANIRINTNTGSGVHTIQFVNSLSVAKGGTGLKTLTSGQLLFGDTAASVSQSANLFWDKTNSRLGLGTSLPASRLTVSGGIAVGSGYISIAAPSNGLIVQGSVGIGVSSPSFKLDVAGQVNASGGFCIAGSCIASWPTATARVGGSGTTNYIAKFTNTSSVGNSSIFDDGSGVGIGTASVSGAKLKVNGLIESITGGFKFPDGTTQTTAASAVSVKPFGGTGVDGALNISSGTTTIDVGGAAVFVRNYSSVSITGTGKLAFTNPNVHGTVIILKSAGDVTLTSSMAPMIDASAMGAAGGAAVGPNAGTGNDGSDGYSFFMLTGKGSKGVYNTTIANPGGSSKVGPRVGSYISRYAMIAPGSGGGSGASSSGSSGNSGEGGNGGGGLVIECAGAWNFTTSGGISVSGQNGGSSTVTSGGGFVGHGGSGGGGGMLIALYNNMIANSGTVTISGGSGGSGNSFGSGASQVGSSGGSSVANIGSAALTSGGVGPVHGVSGGDGFAIITENTEF